MELKNHISDIIAIDKDQNLSLAIEKMEKNHLENLPVTNEGKYIGILSYKNLAKELGSIRKESKPPSRLHVSTAYKKDGGILNINMNLKTAASELASRKSTILPVQDEEKNIIGSLTSFNVLKQIELGKKSIDEIISKNYEIISPSDRVVNARRKILDQKTELLVLKENKNLLGIVTAKEIAKGMSSFRKLVPKEKQDSRIRNLLVEDIMENNFLEIDSSASLKEITEKLVSNKEKKALITEENNTLGFIDQLDLIKAWCWNER